MAWPRRHQYAQLGIGYVELAHGRSRTAFPLAQLVNQAGKTATANADTLGAAIAELSNAFTDKLTATIVDGKSDNAWPISGYTDIILHTTSMKDCTAAEKVLGSCTGR